MQLDCFYVAMEILLLLTVVTLALGAQSSLPNVSYVKAIDIWMLVCLFNICGTLVVIGVGELHLKRNILNT